MAASEILISSKENMEKDRINTQEEDKVYPMITGQVFRVLAELQMPNGMFETYATFIRRLEHILLTKAEELDLDDSTALSYVRVLYLLRNDLEDLSVVSEDREGDEPDNL